MNAVISVSHFCETHGPSVLFSTQPFHFASKHHSGVVEPTGIPFYGCLKKLKDHFEENQPNVRGANCEACESASGFISNDYENKISFLSSRLAVDSNVSCLIKQAAIRSLSCEVVPGREGQIYFGDSVCGHVLSNTFFLKDSQARGFHRWYSILVFMKDKHFLLNSWQFFQQHINQIVLHLQRLAMQVYSNEQNVCSQRAFRLSSIDQKYSTARSLIKLTAAENVFAQLHLWFTWLLSAGAKRLEENLPVQIENTDGKKEQGKFFVNNEVNNGPVDPREEDIYHLRQLRRIFGTYDFLRVLHSIMTGRQVVVRGPQVIVKNIISLLMLFLPTRKVRCQEFGDSYKTPEVCNIVGLNLFAAVPMSSGTIMRLDIVPFQDVGSVNIKSSDYTSYKFMIKSKLELPEKLPSLLVKIDNALSDENLSNRVLSLHFRSLLEQWFHVAEVMQEVKKSKKDINATVNLLQAFGIQEQDDQLLEFWTS